MYEFKHACVLEPRMWSVAYILICAAYESNKHNMVRNIVTLYPIVQTFDRLIRSFRQILIYSFQV